MQTRFVWFSLGVHGAVLVGAGILGGSLAEPPRRAVVRFTLADPVPAVSVPHAPRESVARQEERPMSPLGAPELPIPRDDFADLLPEPRRAVQTELALRPRLEDVAREVVRTAVVQEPVELVRARLLDGENRPPSYPSLARRLGLEGDVVLRLHVDCLGVVGEVELAVPSPHGSLNRAAVAGVRGWRFTPAMRGGVAVADVVEKTIRFRLTR